MSACVRVGAKVAKPDKQVVVLHGDGSFGMNMQELDTAVRHKLPVIVVVSINGGWTADPEGRSPAATSATPGRQDRRGLRGHGEFVEKPHDIRPALERAQGVGQGRAGQRRHRRRGPCADGPLLRLRHLAFPSRGSRLFPLPKREEAPRPECRQPDPALLMDAARPLAEDCSAVRFTSFAVEVGSAEISSKHGRPAAIRIAPSSPSASWASALSVLA